jgi:hypothetical protein
MEEWIEIRDTPYALDYFPDDFDQVLTYIPEDEVGLDGEDVKKWDSDYLELMEYTKNANYGKVMHNQGRVMHSISKGRIYAFIKNRIYSRKLAKKTLIQQQDPIEFIRQFIQQNCEEIFSFVENSRRQVDLGYENQIFGRLLNELVIRFPTCHCDPPVQGHTEFDKAHYELAIAILQVFWCGCLPQMKENRGAYDSGSTNFFRNIITETFDIARQYAPQEERRRAQQ